MITDEVMDAIAHIEMHRQEMEKAASVAAACNEALRKLHELLNREREALQSHGPGAGHAANIEALTAEIERVKRLAGEAGGVAMLKHERPRRQKPVRPGQRHNPPRTKGRRTMGRSSGR
jgi:bacterioferritin-associated ferredoxin